MKNYKIVKSLFSSDEMIFSVSENSWIPPDPANSDYQQYLAWVAEGNTAEEWEGA
jgi:hypothetical protein